jgi:hypothetical protein
LPSQTLGFSALVLVSCDSSPIVHGGEPDFLLFDNLLSSVIVILEGVPTMVEKVSAKDRLADNEQHCRKVFSRLKEQDKRHVAGLLALLVGHGGVSWVADAVGLERDCVSRGKAEVENGLVGRPVDRQSLPSFLYHSACKRGRPFQ